MHLSTWHLFRIVAVALIATVFGLLPLMGGAMVSPAHAGMIHAAGCSGDQPATRARDYVVQVRSDTDIDHCGHVPGQEAACCLGASCPTLQMVELMAIIVPLPNITADIKPARSSATAGQGERPAPTPRPPRQLI